jgi:hypothetical protein
VLVLQPVDRELQRVEPVVEQQPVEPEQQPVEPVVEPEVGGEAQPEQEQEQTIGGPIETPQAGAETGAEPGGEPDGENPLGESKEEEIPLAPPVDLDGGEIEEDLLPDYDDDEYDEFVRVSLDHAIPEQENIIISMSDDFFNNTEDFVDQLNAQFDADISRIDDEMSNEIKEEFIEVRQQPKEELLETIENDPIVEGYFIDFEKLLKGTQLKRGVEEDDDDDRFDKKFKETPEQTDEEFKASEDAREDFVIQSKKKVAQEKDGEEDKEVDEEDDVIDQQEQGVSALSAKEKSQIDLAKISFNNYAHKELKKLESENEKASTVFEFAAWFANMKKQMDTVVSGSNPVSQLKLMVKSSKLQFENDKKLLQGGDVSVEENFRLTMVSLLDHNIHLHSVGNTISSMDIKAQNIKETKLFQERRQRADTKAKDINVQNKLLRDQSRKAAEISMLSDNRMRNQKHIKSRLINERADKRFLYPSVVDKDTFNLVLYKRGADGQPIINRQTGAPVIEEVTSVTRNDAEKLKKQNAVVDAEDADTSPYFPLHGAPCKEFFSKSEFKVMGRKVDKSGKLRVGLSSQTDVQSKIAKTLQLIGSSVGISEAVTTSKSHIEMQNRELYELEAIRDAYVKYSNTTSYNYAIETIQEIDEEGKGEDDFTSIREEIDRLTIAQLLEQLNKGEEEQIVPEQVQSEANQLKKSQVEGVGTADVDNVQDTQPPNEGQEEDQPPPSGGTSEENILPTPVQTDEFDLINSSVPNTHGIGPNTNQTDQLEIESKSLYARLFNSQSVEKTEESIPNELVEFGSRGFSLGTDGGFR